MGKIACTAVLSLMVMTLLTGCWSRHELNDLAITLGVGIDKRDDKYVVSAQTVIPEAVAAKKGEKGAPATIIEESGFTVAEAFRKMTTSSSRKMYLSHLRILVISEVVAREGIQYILDFFKRNRELRPDFYIVVAKGIKAKKALGIMPRLEKVPASRIFQSITVAKKEWSTVGVFVDELTTNIVSKGKEAVLTGIHIIGDSQQGNSMKNTEKLSDVAQVKLSGLGVFKKDKLIGWLNDDENKAYNVITNNVQRTLGRIRCPNESGYIGIDTMSSKGEIKGTVKEGRPEIKVKVVEELSIAEVQCSIDLTKPETIYQMEQARKQNLLENLEKLIHKVQREYRSDIFGFGMAIRRANPKYWSQVENQWDKEFAKLKVHVQVDCKIRRTGAEGNSFITELKKKE